MTTVAPHPTRSAASRLLAPAATAALALGAAAVLHVRDPHTSGSYGFCPFQTLTGLPCPGCGGLRAVNDLTRGDLVGALSSNALAVVLVGGLAVAWVLWFLRRLTPQHDGHRRPVAVSLRTVLTVLGVVAVFGVLRITPWGSWLAP